MVSQTQQAEVYVNEGLEAASNSLAAVCAQMCLAVQGELDSAFPRIATELELEAKRMMADVRGLFCGIMPMWTGMLQNVWLS